MLRVYRGETREMMTPNPALSGEEPWVTLAGVRFRVGHRFYGKIKSVVLRAIDGRAYRLTQVVEGSSRLEGLRYIHDVTIDGETFKVFVAPPDSPVALALQEEPITDGLGAPCLLEAGEKYLAVKRHPGFDARPAEPPDTRKDGLSSALLAEVARIAKARNVTPQTALDYVLRLGLSRIAAAARHEEKRRKAKESRTPAKRPKK